MLGFGESIDTFFFDPDDPDDPEPDEDDPDEEDVSFFAVSFFGAVSDFVDFAGVVISTSTSATGATDTEDCFAARADPCDAEAGDVEETGSIGAAEAGEAMNAAAPHNTTTPTPTPTDH